jgi:acyl-homoserine lactone acylase PvdQ
VNKVWLILVLLGSLALPSIATASPYGKTELLRDRWGVPHVFAETDAGAMYGLGWATAEDRAFQMYYHLRILQGRLAELIGDVKVGATEQRPEGSNSALRSDVKMRVMGFYRSAQQVARHLDRPTLALLQAYSQGVNDYLAQHRGERLYLFDRLGLDPEPWTPADCIASWWRLGQFFAGDGLRDMEGWCQRLEAQAASLSLARSILRSPEGLGEAHPSSPGPRRSAQPIAAAPTRLAQDAG